MPRHFHTKIVGISYEESRKSAVEQTAIAEQLVFSKPDPPLEDYPHALEIHNQVGECLGFLRDSLAIEVDNKIKGGYRYVLIVKALTGGTSSKPNRGVNLLVVQCDPDEGSEEAAAYVNTLIARDEELASIVCAASAETAVASSPQTDPRQDHVAPQRTSRHNKVASFNPLKSISATSIVAAKRAWNSFDEWCGGYEVQEESALASKAQELIGIIKTTGSAFDFSDACEFMGVDESDRCDVAKLVFEEIVRRAWEDHVLDEEEKRTLSWLYCRLDLDKKWARAAIAHLRP